MASKSATAPNNDLSSFLRTSFGARPAQTPVLSAADVQVQSYLDCHHDEYHMRKKNRHNNRPPMPAMASPPPPSTLAKPSLEDVLKMMGAAITPGKSATTTTASPSPTQPASIRRLEDGQRLDLYGE